MHFLNDGFYLFYSKWYRPGVITICNGQEFIGNWRDGEPEWFLMHQDAQKTIYPIVLLEESGI